MYMGYFVPQNYVVKSFIGVPTGNQSLDTMTSQVYSYTKHNSIEEANSAVHKIFFDHNPYGWNNYQLSMENVMVEYDDQNLLTISVFPTNTVLWQVSALIEVATPDPTSSEPPQSTVAYTNVGIDNRPVPRPRLISKQPIFELEEVNGITGNSYIVWTDLSDIEPIFIQWEFHDGFTGWRAMEGKLTYLDQFPIIYRGGFRCLAPSPIFSINYCGGPVDSVRALLSSSKGTLLGAVSHKFTLLSDSGVNQNLYRAAQEVPRRTPSVIPSMPVSSLHNSPNQQQLSHVDPSREVFREVLEAAAMHDSSTMFQNAPTTIEQLNNDYSLHQLKYQQVQQPPPPFANKLQTVKHRINEYVEDDNHNLNDHTIDDDDDDQNVSDEENDEAIVEGDEGVSGGGGMVRRAQHRFATLLVQFKKFLDQKRPSSKSTSHSTHH